MQLEGPRRIALWGILEISDRHSIMTHGSWLICTTTFTDRTFPPNEPRTRIMVREILDDIDRLSGVELRSRPLVAIQSFGYLTPAR